MMIWYIKWRYWCANPHRTWMTLDYKEILYFKNRIQQISTICPRFTKNLHKTWIIFANIIVKKENCRVFDRINSFCNFFYRKYTDHCAIEFGFASEMMSILNCKLSFLGKHFGKMPKINSRISLSLCKLCQ